MKDSHLGLFTCICLAYETKPIKQQKTPRYRVSECAVR